VTTTPSGNDTKLRVAIVDDEPSVRSSLERLCSVMGMDATAYASGRKFLDALDNGATPACLLLDAHMPELSGLDVLRLLALRGGGPATIVITADDGPEIYARVIAAGAVECLQKPITAEELVAAIERAMACS
jgi:two-component system response regulator FixJ